ncbi:MAG: hypothetical protein P8Y51_01455 [Campylobacterales bacterium]
MQKLSGFKRRSTALKTMLFAYAVGFASLGCVQMPLLGYGSAALFAAAFVLLGYTLWWFARPAAPKEYVLFGLSLVGIGFLSALLYVFGNEIAVFKSLQLHGSVTEPRRLAYRNTLLLLLAIHTAAAAATSGLFYALFRFGKADIARTFFLGWAPMPALFLLMHLYDFLLPSVSAANLLLLFAGWLLLTAAVGYGSYQLTAGRASYVAVFTSLTFFAPPIGGTAFVLFVFLSILMPPVKEETPDEMPTAGGRKPLYSKQLRDAEADLKSHASALEAIDTKIRSIDPGSAGAIDVLRRLETKKSECLVRKVAAEEALDRLQRLQNQRGKERP